MKEKNEPNQIIERKKLLNEDEGVVDLTNFIDKSSEDGDVIDIGSKTKIMSDSFENTTGADSFAGEYSIDQDNDIIDLSTDAIIPSEDFEETIGLTDFIDESSVDEEDIIDLYEEGDIPSGDVEETIDLVDFVDESHVDEDDIIDLDAKAVIVSGDFEETINLHSENQDESSDNDIIELEPEYIVPQSVITVPHINNQEKTDKIKSFMDEFHEDNKDIIDFESKINIVPEDADVMKNDELITFSSLGDKDHDEIIGLEEIYDESGTAGFKEETSDKSAADNIDKITVFAPPDDKDEEILGGSDPADDLSLEDIAGLEDSDRKSVADDVDELTVFAPQKSDDEDIITGFEEPADDLSLEDIAGLEDSDKKVRCR